MSQRILHIGNGQLRRHGKMRISWTHKLYRGFTQNGNFIHLFSDRDTAAFEAPLGIRDLGIKKANKRLLECAQEVEADLILVGHANIISNETLSQMKECTGAKLVHCNVDPVFVPKNVAHVKERAEICDAIFTTTAPSAFQKEIPEYAHFHFMPNLLDAAYERFQNHLKPSAELTHDLLYWGNSKGNTERETFLGELKEELADHLRFSLYGFFGTPPVWGKACDQVLSETKLGLNLNRQEGFPWYTSDRIIQYMGNGILSFSHASNKLEETMPAEGLVTFSDLSDLREKVLYYHAHDEERKEKARLAYDYVHTHFNGKNIARFILSTVFPENNDENFPWV